MKLFSVEVWNGHDWETEEHFEFLLVSDSAELAKKKAIKRAKKYWTVFSNCIEVTDIEEIKQVDGYSITIKTENNEIQLSNEESENK